jgi:hypothetical protein
LPSASERLGCQSILSYFPSVLTPAYSRTELLSVGIRL